MVGKKMLQVGSMRWQKVLFWLMTLAAIIFLCLLAWRQRHEILALLSGADVLWLSLGFLLLLLSNISCAFFFLHFVRREDGMGADSPTVLGVFLFSQVAKYIPGRIWGVVMQAGMARGGLSIKALAVSNLEIAFVLIVSSLGLSAAALAWLFSGVEVALVVLLSVALVCYVLLSVRFTRKIVDVVMRERARSEACNHASLKKNDLGYPSWISCIACIAYVACCFFGWLLVFTCGLGYGLNDGMVLLSASFVAAVAGMISMMPGGVGVREAAMLGIAGLGSMEGSGLVSAVVSARLCILAVDVMSAVVGGVLVKWGRIKTD